MLLDKDPRRRFQTPADLLKALPTIRGAIDEGRTITYQSLGQMPEGNFYSVTRKRPARLGPEKISVARLPITGSDLFGREEDIAFLDEAWANQRVNVVTIVAWAGVGKSTLVNHWLGRLAAEHYHSARLVFGWSFYRQGTNEFLDAALAWFGDPDPRLGTAWEKGERLAKLISHRRTLLVLDGLEPLQNPPGPQEGRVRDPSLQALLRELAAFNMGLCVLRRGCRLRTLQITSTPQPRGVTWNNSPAMPAQNCSERWASKAIKRSCEVPATSSVAIVSRSRFWAAI